MTIIRSLSTSRRTKRSMQYYRLWIYSCNGILGVTSAVFAVSAAFVLADVRLSLLGGVELYHPTFLYAYAALIIQCGVIQTIGCLGAQRLSHKLLSVYWILLLLLTIGDVVVGLVWVFKLDKVKLNLRPLLTREFISKYSRDESFTRTWNIVQSEEHCCGVDGPLDYENLSQVQSHQFQHSKHSNTSLKVDVESSLLSLPESCCIFLYDSASVGGSGGLRDSLNQTHGGANHPFEKEFPISSNESSTYRGGGGGDWDNRGNGNVTGEFSLGESHVEESSGSVSHSSRVQGDFDYDSLVLNDPPQPTLDSESEEPFAIHDRPASVVHKNNASLLVVNPSVFKHKVRHGNHRWKIRSHNNNSSNISNITLNDTIFVKAEPLTSEESQNKIKIKSKIKAKTLKLFPTFSIPKHTQQTTQAPEYAEKLPVPFTCQSRHLKVDGKQQRVESDVSQSNQDNNKPSTIMSNNRLNSVVEIGDTTDKTVATDTFSSASLEVDRASTNFNAGEVEMNEETVESENQEFLESREDQNPGKINSPDSSLRDSKTQASNFQPVVDSNVFSFLHASAFTSSEDEDNGNSVGDKTSSGRQPGDTANEIQAAYYFSSAFYQSNSFNSSLSKRFQVYRHGCGMKMIMWVDHVSGILFILGFCIIGFVKVSFLIILRTEIREMIEKIQLLELEDPVSPTRSYRDQRIYVSHPLLAHPHRASTVSAHAYNAALPTIKSPEGSTGPSRFPKSYHQRRHSNIIGDRGSAHSQETVNMTLMVTNNSGGPCTSSKSESKHEKGRSNPNLSNFPYDFDPISISVPNTAKYLRRSSTCSVTAHTNPSYSYLQYDENRPGPSSRLCHHQHCFHSHHARPRLYTRNMSIGAVVHHSGGSAGPSVSGTATAFRSFGGESGSGNCSFSSRDENEILSASMDNVGEDQSQSEQPQSDDEKEKERRDAEIRDWAASTICTDLQPIDGSCEDIGEKAAPTTIALSLVDYSKAGFNHSSDSAESNDRNSGGRRNGNNNVDVECIPLSYRGTAV